MYLRHLTSLLALQIGLYVYAFTVSLYCDHSIMNVIVSSTRGFYGIVKSRHRSGCSIKGNGELFVALPIPLDNGNRSQCGVVKHDGAFVTPVDIRLQPNIETNRDCTLLIRCPLDNPLQHLRQPFQIHAALADAHLAVTHESNSVDIAELRRIYTLEVNILKSPQVPLSVGQCIAFSDESNSLRMLQLTDDSGCPASHEIIDGFNELTDADSVRSKWQAHMRMFKFNDSHYFYIQCQIVGRRDHIERYTKERCASLSVDTVGLLEPTDLLSTFISTKVLISTKGIRQQQRILNKSDSCNELPKERITAYALTLFLGIITAAVWIVAFMRRPSILHYTASDGKQFETCSNVLNDSPPLESMQRNSSGIAIDNVEVQSRDSSSYRRTPNCSAKKSSLSSEPKSAWNDEQSDDREHTNKSNSPSRPFTQIDEITVASEIFPGQQSREQKELPGANRRLDDVGISEPLSNFHSEPLSIRNGTLDRPMKKWARKQIISPRISSISSKWQIASVRKRAINEKFPDDRRVSDATLIPHDELLQFDRPEAVISIVDSVFTGSSANTENMNVLRSVHVNDSITRLESNDYSPTSADIVTTQFIGRREMIERISKRDMSRQNFSAPHTSIKAMKTSLSDDGDSSSYRPSDASSWRYLNPEALALQASETELNSNELIDSNRFAMRLKGNKTYNEI